ncbi:MAG: hypothetical protein K0R89_1842 [Ramlibacter sp.]|jgi:hypothetical protein|nr:hypothetical protein [Ramlibacter sp.]
MRRLAAILFACIAAAASAQTAEVLDLPTRPNVTQRALVLRPAAEPASVVVLLTGSTGQVGIFGNGSLRFEANFLVRSRSLFLERGHAVVVLDPPSDRRDLGGNFRESAEHAADLGAVVAWARRTWGKPVWLVGTSRGTHSAAEAARVLQGAEAPDGIVLTSTIVARGRWAVATSARPVTEIDLTGAKLPVLVVHHQKDACQICDPALLPALMRQLPAGRSELLTYDGGVTRGAECDAWAHHGFNGIEDRVVGDISSWIKARP